MKVDRPGLYAMTEAAYHADPCPEPSLSASTAHALLTRSPLHAWTGHPRLNPNWRPREATEEMEEGSALHWLLLGGSGAEPVVVDSDSFRAKDAQAARDDARAAGRPPILRRRWNQLRRCAAAVRSELRRTLDAPPGVHVGDPEAVLVWKEDDLWCRAMVDWLPSGCADPVPLIDLKSLGRVASPEAFSRRMAEHGHDVQAAFYRRGFRAVFGREPGPMVFLAFERKPPYAVSRIACGAQAEELGESKVEEALRIWGRCLDRDDWPGFPRRVAFVEPPRWAETDWEMRRERGGRQLADGSGRGARRPVPPPRRPHGGGRVDPARFNGIAARIGGPVA